MRSLGVGGLRSWALVALVAARVAGAQPGQLVAQIPPVSPPECIAGCDSSGPTDREPQPTGGILNLIDRLQERAEAAAAQRRAEAHQQNVQGVAAFKRRDYAEALRLFRLAQGNDPENKVIRQNIANSEVELERLAQEQRRQEVLSREQADHRKRMEKLAELMPVIKTVPGSGAPVGRASAKVPLPGFTSADWTEYLDAQAVVDRLYARLNKEGALSNADAQAFYAALRRRNELWAVAQAQPHTAAERDRLRLPLPVVAGKALVRRLLSGAQPAPATSSPSSARSSNADAITTAFVAEFFADKATTLFEGKVGDALEAAHEEKLGEKLKGRYEKLHGLARVAVSAQEGGAPAAGAETADLIISQMPEPMTQRAEHAVEGGRLYSNVALQALNRFMTDASRATGGTFDAEAFWTGVNADLTQSQKAVKEWIQFGN